MGYDNRARKLVTVGILVFLILLGVGMLLTVSVRTSESTGAGVETASSSTAGFPWDFLMVVVIMVLSIVMMGVTSLQYKKTSSKSKNDELANQEKPKRKPSYGIGADGELLEIIEDKAQLFDELEPSQQEDTRR